MADQDARLVPEMHETLPAGPSKRRKLFMAFGSVLAVLGLIYGIWYYFIGSTRITTDNAYVGAEVASITPLVSGPVVEAPVIDTQRVKKGDVLVIIDNTDAKLALAEATAELNRAERKVQQYFATDTSLNAQIAARDADIAKARADVENMSASFERATSDLDRARLDFKRRQALAASGAVSGEELSNAKAGLRSAEAALSAAHSMVAGSKASLAQAVANRGTAKGQLKVNSALVEGTSISSNPEVAVARAKVNQAELDVVRCIIRAPIDGLVARRQVQLGQRVQAGTQLMSVVPIDKVYVDANFKESQLQKVLPGQHVKLTSDLYGSDVEYDGTVIGLAGGTGSAFSIIPAQNASGNWIKVVQRVPVRIVLDPKMLAKHPLRVGLSMNVMIDTTTGGK